jgi:hypothetical protein
MEWICDSYRKGKMKKFFNLLENVSNITIGYKYLEETFKVLADKHIEGIRDTKYRLGQFNVDSFFKNLQIKLKDYPLLKNLIRALQSKNYRYIFDQTKKLRDWMSAESAGRYNQAMAEITRDIRTYEDFMDQDTGLAEEQVIQYVKTALEGTKPKMEEIRTLIKEAISRTIQWNNTPIHIEARAIEDEYGPKIEPAEDAEITMGAGEFAPNFTFFRFEEKINIEDVLEGGDKDFFHTPEIQSDYFNLIAELKHPGSTNRGKMITLYTARPTQDRQQLINSQTLPINIFLTNSYDHAEGIAIDLGGSQGVRDIWKVRIDSKYLIQTLDGPVKYYQLVKANAPVRMELISHS